MKAQRVCSFNTGHSGAQTDQTLQKFKDKNVASKETSPASLVAAFVKYPELRNEPEREW